MVRLRKRSESESCASNEALTLNRRSRLAPVFFTCVPLKLLHPLPDDSPSVVRVRRTQKKAVAVDFVPAHVRGSNEVRPQLAFDVVRHDVSGLVDFVRSEVCVVGLDNLTHLLGIPCRDFAGAFGHWRNDWP